MTICIIPARAGSKRIKNKNIRIFNKKTFIQRTIETAKKSKLFSRIIVSTDSKKIANLSLKYEAEVPFLRSSLLADDFASTAEVLKDCIKNLKIKDKFFFCIYPVNPLLKSSDLIKAFKKIKKFNQDSLITVSEYDYSPYRAFKYCGHNNIKYIYPRYALSRSQDLPMISHDTGTFYIFRTKKFILSKKSLLKKTTFYKLDRFSFVDVNTPEDLKYAHFLYKFKKDKK
jgi:pseudaminic acid cytidylyltransferase